MASQQSQFHHEELASVMQNLEKGSHGKHEHELHFEVLSELAKFAFKGGLNPDGKDFVGIHTIIEQVLY